MSKTKPNGAIPTRLTESQFNEFICPHLSKSTRGRKQKLSDFKIFGYICLFLYTGVQWKELPIEKDINGKPEIHYTSIFKRFKKWSDDGSFDGPFVASVCLVQKNELLDITVIHGDGTCTVCKKGGDNIGYNGHKHNKGQKNIAFCCRNCNVISANVTAPGNRNESVLLKPALSDLSRVATAASIKLDDTTLSLDGVYDSKSNRKLIFNRGMTPNMGSLLT